jgi:lipopolysaccharide transport system ATP-binding protein
MSSDDIAVRAVALAKCYQIYDRPSDRLKQMLWRGRRKFFRDFWALRDVDLEVRQGEVLGIIGRNGAGKSTLLQLICGTLAPTSGELSIDGRIAPLLELGAGFNPDFSGRENIYLNASILGMSKTEIDRRCDEIIDFSGIRDFIDQPVKTYSSGMYVRLAFSIAISVNPDILVIDEALSVGDGEFSRKSFDRIIAMKEAGKTILFCSHSTYQVEALCSRALWLERGAVKMLGPAASVVSAYVASLNAEAHPQTAVQDSLPRAVAGSGSILKVSASAGGATGNKLLVQSKTSTLEIAVSFSIDPSLPAPTVGLALSNEAGAIIASATTHNDGIRTAVGPNGQGKVTVRFPQIPLLKGRYFVSAYLACERAIHVYDAVESCAEIIVEQRGIEQGVVALPREWIVGA